MTIKQIESKGCGCGTPKKPKTRPRPTIRPNK